MAQMQKNGVMISDVGRLDLSDAFGYWPRESGRDLILPLKNVVLAATAEHRGYSGDAELIFRGFSKVEFDYYRQLSPVVKPPEQSLPPPLVLSQALESFTFSGVTPNAPQQIYELCSKEHCLPMARNESERIYIVGIRASAQNLLFISV